jgi:hypothetical protein
MRARLAELFPYVVAFVLPAAGLVLAGAKAVSDDRHDATILLVAAVLGTLAWISVLTI